MTEQSADVDDLNPDNYHFVDHHKSKKKAQMFLKNIAHKENIDIHIKSNFKQMEGVSLMLFSVDSWIRRTLYRTIDNKVFDGVILLVITISTVQFAIDNPLNDPNSKIMKVNTIIDNCTTAVFTIEIVFKIVVFGFLFNGEHSYLRSYSN